MGTKMQRGLRLAAVITLIIFTTLLGQTSARQIYDKDVSTSRWRELLVNSTTRTGPTLNTTNLIVKNFNETLTERIVNGDQAPQGRFPYLGFLTANDCAPSTIHGDCGSTLVSPRVVVTAGHCMFQCGSETWDGLPGETRGPPGFSYTYGSANVKLNRWDMLNSNEPGAEDKDIVKVVRHPWYKRDNSINIPAQNDIALLQLNSKSEVIPVRLNKNETFENGTTFQVAGWGSTNQEGTQFPNIIRYASVPYVPLEECRADLSYNVWEKNVCAGGGPDQADTCIGDSGGPMVLNGLEDPDKHEQVGITSYGAPCGEAPAVYVNVAEQRDWIDNAILLNNMLGYVEPSIQTSYRLQHRYLSNKMRQRFNITSSGECSLTCKADNMGCKSWSYDSELNKCYMMANVTKVVVNAAFTSGNITGTLPAGNNAECQYDTSARYTSARPLHTYTEGYATTSPGACCGTCKVRLDCQGMTYNKETKECQLWERASYHNGWGRKNWNYNYVSAIVARSR